ncbi:MAG TPA: 2-isopropylmalate synthase [Candidatus Hydrogenedens sp.]|nr:2-isopropylmalate synthase [Candidatus Hydrogenedens sp.]HPP58305.1 2-isopropylmalate synthase [Candidatus Hydrogenedens sp.]
MSIKFEVFDTTLRDGEQSPGASMNAQEKYQMALQLEKLGVDTIEAGFPIASKQEFESVQKIAGAIKKCRVAALARALDADIKCAIDALKHAEKPTLHTFIASSEIHMEYKLKMTPKEVLQRAKEAVKLSKSAIQRVEFSAEDATRSRWDFLVDLAKTAIDAGADVINLPDTVGYTTPNEIKEMFAYVIEKVQPPEHVIFSCHNHNDLGLAVSNALAALEGGARQIECTVNGIGERAGNTSMEELVMIIHTRHDIYPYTCNIITTEIMPSSNLLSKLTGLKVPYNKPIVGRNAFAHESGIHQHGVIANTKTYEIITPELIGNVRSTLVLGKHSGRAGLAKRCEELGYNLSKEELDKLYEKFMVLAERKKEIYDEDILLLIVSLQQEQIETYHLEQVRTAGHDPYTALVKLRKGEEVFMDTAIGDGPVDAACKAIERITGVLGQLEQFDIRATTPGKDAIGEATLVVKFNGKKITGNGSSTDIVEAAVKAYLNAVNKYLAIKGALGEY